MSRLVLSAIRDLFFSAKLAAQAESLGISVKPASPELAPEADLAIVHLASFGMPWEQVVADLHAADPDLPLLGFGPHLDGELMKRARAAGCHKVVANSAFASDLPALIERYARRRPSSGKPA